MSVLDVDHPSLVESTAVVVGVLTLSLSVAVAFGGALTTPLVTLLSPVFGTGFVVLAGLLAGAMTVYSLYERSTGPSRSGPAVSVPAPPATDDRGDARTVGDRVDTLLAEIHADDTDSVGRIGANVSRRRVRARVRRLAAEVIRDAENCSLEEASERLQTGAWTDRPRAKAFLGRDVPRLPVSVRLRDWASGEGFRRRAAAAVEEVAAVADVAVGDSIAPPPVESPSRRTGADSRGVRRPDSPTVDAREVTTHGAVTDRGSDDVAGFLDDSPAATETAGVDAQDSPVAPGADATPSHGTESSDVSRRTVAPSDEPADLDTRRLETRTADSTSEGEHE